MSKAYNHIKLPKSLISRESNFQPPPKRNIKEPEVFKVEQKTLLEKGIKDVKLFYENKSGYSAIQNDKKNKEVKISFKDGLLNRQLVKKYGIVVYKKEKLSGSEVIYGKIADTKLPLQKASDFERLVEDIECYKESPEHKYKTLFKDVNDIKPLTLNEITQKELLTDIEDSPDGEHLVDISFADRADDIEEKIEKIKKQFGTRFLSKLNSELVHFCRIKASGREIRNLAQMYAGILSVEYSPRYRIRPSSVSRVSDGMNIVPPPSDAEPVLILDTPVNIEHLALKGAVVSPVNQTEAAHFHGTAVASLVIAGMGLSANQVIKMNNRVICINVFKDLSNLEANIDAYVSQYSKKYQLLIINLSFNETSIYTDNSNYSKLTLLLDELSIKYNCLFFISAGNLLDWDMEDPSQRQLYEQCKDVGYPAYFKLPFTRIQQPANSINNISVGSVAYQMSANSIAKIKHPSPHTRGNIDHSPFIKPDLVNYDSNYNKEYSEECNGPKCADIQNESLTQLTGTSFATPLACHDAALLHQKYPEYNATTIKALLLHFAEKTDTADIQDEITNKLVGFGMPNIDNTIHSFNHCATIVIEDQIGINKSKIVKFPIPSCISGDHKKRLRIRKTLVYNPRVNSLNNSIYNPLNISAKFQRKDQKNIDGTTTARADKGAHRKSNVKKYPHRDFSTRKNAGEFWYIHVTSELLDEDALPSEYSQKFSLIITVEDLKPSDDVDLHEEIINMIDIETNIETSAVEVPLTA